MIFELRTYDLRPGDVPRYMNLFAAVGRGIITRHLPLKGYFFAETGGLNRLFHLWQYENLADRARRRTALYQDADWLRDFVPHGLPLLLSQHSRIWTAAPGSGSLPSQAKPGETLRQILLIESAQRIDGNSQGQLLVSLTSLTGPAAYLHLEAFADHDLLQHRLTALRDADVAVEILQPYPFSPLR
jgi:hypothetical protein